MNTAAQSATAGPTGVLFKLGFRPFFLAAGVYAVVAMALWMAIYVFQWPAPFAAFNSFQWHAHEMIYGYALAVIAGFLLTAVSNWTGLETWREHRLALLFVLWLAARLIWLSGAAPIQVAGVLDLLFIGLLIYAVARPCIQARQWNQMGIVSKLLLLGAGNALFYAGATGLLADGVHWGLYGGLYLVIGLILTMARRVVPFFIEMGVGYEVRLFNSKWLDLSSLFLFLGFFVSEVFAREPEFSAWLAAGLFAVTTVRLIGWHTPGIWKKPLLWSLYLALAFIDLGFALFVASVYGDTPVYLALHAFAFGGIGVITLSMMSRVSLGHTGRNVQAPPAGVTPALMLLIAGALVRVVLPLVAASFHLYWVALSQLMWIAAFALFVRIYAPMLISPRIDGKPG